MGRYILMMLRSLWIGAWTGSAAVVWVSTALAVHRAGLLLGAWMADIAQIRLFLAVGSAIGAIVVGAPALFVLYWVWRLYRPGRRLVSLSAEVAASIDRRAPILYLRSFDDDVSDIDAVLITSYEEHLVKYLDSLGPVVAARLNGAAAPLEGAYTLTAGEDWEPVVYRWIERSQLIVFQVGRPTRGVTSELHYCLSSARDKLILFLPRYTEGTKSSTLALMIRAYGLDELEPAAELVELQSDEASRAFVDMRREKPAVLAGLLPPRPLGAPRTRWITSLRGLGWVCLALALFFVYFAGIVSSSSP